MALQIADTKAALEELKDKIENFTMPAEYQRWLDQQAKFHKYSFRNTLLIWMQKPEATDVAGYQAWINKFGRQVRTGEKAIKILAPVPFTKKNESTGKDESGVFFKVTSVFDVSQTDPIEGAKNVYVAKEPLYLDDDSGAELYDLNVTWMTEDGCTVQTLSDGGHAGTGGWYAHASSEIYIRPASKLRMLEVMIHETAHRLQKGLDKKEDYGYAGNEVVVESAAYVVCRYFGLDVTLSAVPYVRSWLGEDRKQFEKGMGTTSRLADKIIAELERRQKALSEES